jgi:hypothetical protein
LLLRKCVHRHRGFLHELDTRRGQLLPDRQVESEFGGIGVGRRNRRLETQFDGGVAEFLDADQRGFLIARRYRA